MSLITALAPYVRPASPAVDGCELCAAPLGEAHRHVVDLEEQRMLCACRACGLLFTEQAAAQGRFRTVPDRVLRDPHFELDETTWSMLEIPVRLAFVFFQTAADRWVAFYPSPAGATQSELSLGGWSALASRSPLVRALEPDVEALLVRGRRGEHLLDPYLVPIDVCYRLVALVRRHWKGFDGGDARAQIDGFFHELRRRSRPLPSSRKPSPKVQSPKEPFPNGGT